MARPHSTEIKWQKELGCSNVGEICWCDKCCKIEKRMEAGIEEARNVLKKYIEVKDDSPEKDAIIAVLDHIKPLTRVDLFKSY